MVSSCAEPAHWVPADEMVAGAKALDGVVGEYRDVAFGDDVQVGVFVDFADKDGALGDVQFAGVDALGEVVEDGEFAGGADAQGGFAAGKLFVEGGRGGKEG